jgi:hypothetical protein
MSTFKTLLACLLLLSSCKNNIETAQTLTAKDITRIQKLQLLDNDETIVQFYSEFRKTVVGNFYTNKRLANYWLDDDSKAKTQINSAYYNNILKIDTVYHAGATYCPYLLVTKKDSSSFKVYVEGSRSAITGFFTGAINQWQQKANSKN